MNMSNLAAEGHPSQLRHELEQGISVSVEGQGQLVFSKIKVTRLAQTIHNFMFIFLSFQHKHSQRFLARI